MRGNLTRIANKRILTLIIVILSLAFAGGLAYWIAWGFTRLPVVNAAPNWTLQNINGQRQSFQDLAPKVKLVEFIYLNCPDICPTTTINMVSIQEQLKKRHLFGNKTEFVTITFDPTRDTPANLKNYGNKLKVDWSGWNFYTGTEQEIQEVLKSYNLFAEKQDDGFFTHPTKSLFLIDQNNNIRKIYTMGKNMDNQQILEDILELTKSS